jgi:hypothetical protein
MEPLSDDLELINVNETDTKVYEEITRLIFIKTGVCLRSDTDEKIVYPGFLCLLSQDDLYSFSWVKTSSVNEEESDLYLDIAKRTKNSISLNRSPESSQSNGTC